MALRPKQQRFVDEYLIDLNATQAARRADQAGYQLLRKAEIQSAIQARQQALLQQCAVTQQQVIEQWRQVAFFDPASLAPFADQRSPLQVLARLPLEVRMALEVTISANAQGTLGTLRPKSSEKALDQLSERLALFAETDPLTTLGPGMMGLLEARKQLAARLEALAVKARENGQGHEG